MPEVEVSMGEIAVTDGKDVLTALGVGSCLIIALYDPKKRIGGLAHTMLAKSNCHDGENGRNTKYADAAIDEMIKKMNRLGAQKTDIEAKLAGGANMFSDFESNIGKEIILSAKEKLKREGIPLIGESVGGSMGRTVEFCVSSGIITVKIKF